MKGICSKIVYFVFANFFEVKNAFRNFKIKILGWFGEFSNDYPISHWNFIAIRCIFDGHRNTIKKASKISIGIRWPSKDFDGISTVIEIPLKFSMLFRWYFDDHRKWIEFASNLHRNFNDLSDSYLENSPNQP